MARNYKCWYKNCPIGKVEENEAIQIGRKRYHKDCYTKLENLKEVRDLYFNYIDNTVVFTQLNTVINNIINKGISSSYLLYAIKYAIDNEIEVRYPASLFYLINNYKIRNAYNNAEVETSLKIYS